MFSSRSCTNTAQKTHSKDTPGCSGKSCHDQHLGASRQARVTSRSRDARGAVWHVPHAACPERREPPKRRERGSQGRRGSARGAPGGTGAGGAEARRARPRGGAGRGRRARSPAEDEESARRYLVGSRRLRAPAAGKKETLRRAPCLPGGAGRGQLSRGFWAALARETEREGHCGVRLVGLSQSQGRRISWVRKDR